MTISELRRSSLPDEFVDKLCIATEAHSELATLRKLHPELTIITQQLLFLFDTYSHFFTGDSIPIKTIIHDSFIHNPMSEVSRFVNAYDGCRTYAANRVAEASVLTAIDIVKINRTLCNTYESQLSEKDPFLDHLPCIDSFWLILRELYGPKQQYPHLLEAAIAFVRFLTHGDEEKPSILALSILLSHIPDGKLSFDGLLSQWALYTDPRWTFTHSKDHNSILLHVLSVFENTWRFHSRMFYDMIDIEKKISQRLKISNPAATSFKMTRLLSQSVCLRIADMKEKLGVSLKTASNRLKELEQVGVLYSVKVGRDQFYFNNIYCDYLKELI